MSDSITAQSASKVVEKVSNKPEGEGSDEDNETLQLAIKLSKAMIKEEKPNKPKEQQKIIITSEISLKDADYMQQEGDFSLDNLVKELESTLAKGHYKDEHIFNKVQWLIEHYDGNEEDYNKYAIKLDENQYTRNLIKKTPYFTLMLLMWPPNISSPIHDHGSSECWLRVIKGSLEERFYEKPAQESSAIKLRFSQVHKANAVCFINDEQGLHSINNPLDDKWAVSLHCYVPGYEACNAYFDKKNAGKGKKKCKLTFTSIDGQLINQ